jgi:hypothetical protein
MRETKQETLGTARENSIKEKGRGKGKTCITCDLLGLSSIWLNGREGNVEKRNVAEGKEDRF